MALSVFLYFAFMYKIIAHNGCDCKQKVIACNNVVNLVKLIILDNIRLLCFINRSLYLPSIYLFSGDHL